MVYTADYEPIFTCIHTHTHTHTICEHSEGTSIHTPACARESCCKDLYDKVADRQWQGCDPTRLTADADSVIALALCVCVCVCLDHSQPCGLKKHVHDWNVGMNYFSVETILLPLSVALSDSFFHL